MHILSKEKIQDLKDELGTLEKSLEKENIEQTLRGGPMDSFKEAAAFSISKQAKEARINDIKTILDDCIQLQENIKGQKIVLGKVFVLKGNNGIRKFKLVDPAEADPVKGYVSIQSPIGMAVINKTKNSSVKINNCIYEIIDII